MGKGSKNPRNLASKNKFPSSKPNFAAASLAKIGQTTSLLQLALPKASLPIGAARQEVAKDPNIP